ncbi:DUF4870 domain-containing protein [Flavobacterium sp. RHBU_3]|uniref:DUF4870 domain-containing protein n=1 Tax=Flavobacterium sp. RHBU_3 TaxID=3391184 RepID=UPI003985192C
MTTNTQTYQVQPYEYEPAANAYLMSIAGIVCGLPLPIVNTTASIIYFLARRKSSYFIRWHALQALLAQLVVMPFNSLLLGWTISIFIKNGEFSERAIRFGKDIPQLYWAYLIFIIIINIFEFIAVITASSDIHKGKNVRFLGIATITDVLCRK